MFGKKIRIDAQLYNRAKALAAKTQCASVDQLVVHLLERELKNFESERLREKMVEKMKGVGYF